MHMTFSQSVNLCSNYACVVIEHLLFQTIYLLSYELADTVCAGLCLCDGCWGQQHIVNRKKNVYPLCCRDICASYHTNQLALDNCSNS